MRAITTVVALAFVCAAPGAVHAFCGFYVGGADTELYNNATVVALMRDGTRTVLSMQNNYRGPPSDFAMVVPVPVVLAKKQVKTLPPEIFDHLDKLAAPRLVEYWEQDPCAPYKNWIRISGSISVESSRRVSYSGRQRSHGVKVEAKFSVAEYDVVILSAKDSTGLDAWLQQEGYKIPAGAEKVLRPYVAQGMKFFVAKVDASKVTFKDGQAVLSPLRVHFDAEQFNLPVRLGMINSEGSQDLIVHILARMTRYEVANYENVTIPTNLELTERSKKEFGSFYTALFDATLEAHPRAVITEYSWQASSCDPCPMPGLTPQEVATLGGDVVASSGDLGAFVLTRLHARYEKGDLGEDMVFRAAPPIVGGREHNVSQGRLERGASVAKQNNFQGRYIVRHPWTGAIECEKPERGVWGAPPGQNAPLVQAAEDLGFAPASKGKLEDYLRTDVEAIDYSTAKRDGAVKFRPSGIDRRGCGGCGTSLGGGSLVGLLLAGVLVLRRRRYR